MKSHDYEMKAPLKTLDEVIDWLRTSELMTADQVRALLSAETGKYASVTAWAQIHEQHAPYIYDMIKGRKPISKRVCQALGLRKVDRWERKS